MKLYEIQNEMDKVLDEGGVFVNSDTGEVLDDGALDSLNGEFNDKLDSIGAYVKGLMASAKAHKEEAKNQAAMAAADENKAKSLIEYVRRHTEEGKRYKLTRCDWRWRKSTSVNVIDEEAVPDNYKKMTVSVDKAAAKKALAAGEEIPGLKLEEKVGLSVK